MKDKKEAHEELNGRMNIKALSVAEYSLDGKRIIGGSARLLFDRMVPHTKEAVDYLSRTVLALYSYNTSESPAIKEQFEAARKNLLLEANNNEHIKENLRVLILRTESPKATEEMFLVATCIVDLLPEMAPKRKP